jgi:hypothetical protein
MGKDKYRGKIAELINNGPDRLITGGVDDNRIVEVEKELNVTLPESYKWFLREFGYASVAGVEILGMAPTGVPPVVEYTLDFRETGMPDSWVVICSCDEWVYCLVTDKMVNGECPVIDWDNYTGDSFQYFDNFYLFLINELESAINDWED